MRVSVIGAIMINGILKKSLTALINKKLKEAGRVSELDFDRKAGVLVMTLSLVGESEPVHVTLKGLSLSNDGKISFASAESSREWVHLLLNSYSERLKIKIPEKYLTVVAPLLPETSSEK